MTTKNRSTPLYFYYPETDELFFLKNYNTHLNLRLFGTFRNINIYQMYKEKIKIYHREYNRKNKKKCECCNREYSIINYYSHNKTKKHLLNMSKNISATPKEQT